MKQKRHVHTFNLHLISRTFQSPHLLTIVFAVLVQIMDDVLQLYYFACCESKASKQYDRVSLTCEQEHVDVIYSLIGGEV